MRIQCLLCRYIWYLTLYVAYSESSTDICEKMLLKCIELSYVLFSFFLSLSTKIFIGDIKYF